MGRGRTIVFWVLYWVGELTKYNLLALIASCPHLFVCHDLYLLLLGLPSNISPVGDSYLGGTLGDGQEGTVGNREGRERHTVITGVYTPGTVYELGGMVAGRTLPPD